MSEKESGTSGGSPQASAVTVSDVQELIRRKEEIEAQIQANYSLLESVSVGSGLAGGVWAPQGLGLGPDSGPGPAGLGARAGSAAALSGGSRPPAGPRRRNCGLCRQPRGKLRRDPRTGWVSSSAFMEPLMRAGRSFTGFHYIGELILSSQQPFEVELCYFPHFRDEETEALLNLDLPLVTELSLQRLGD